MHLLLVHILQHLLHVHRQDLTARPFIRALILFFSLTTIPSLHFVHLLFFLYRFQSPTSRFASLSLRKHIATFALDVRALLPIEYI